MRGIRLLAPLLMLLLLTARLEAQEAQVPFDRAGRVEVVDAELARRLGLFTAEYPGFVEARLFQAADSSYTLEVLVRREGRLLRERRALTADEVRSLRERVGQRARPAPAEALSQEGRNLLLGQTSLMGLFFYGPAMIHVLGASDGSSAAGTYLLTAGASFFLPFALTQGQTVTYGMSNLSRYGVTRGALRGALLYDATASADEPLASDARAHTAAAVLGSVAEGVAGYHWARAERMTPGTAATIGMGGDLGLVWGISTAVLLDVEDRARVGSLFALAGSAAGIYGGYRHAQRRDYTWGDAGVVYASAALGLYATLSTLSLTDVEAESPFGLAAIAGSAAGAWYGDRLVADKDFSVSQASLVQLGTLAGGVMGLGVAAMAEAEDEDAYLFASALGALGGFGLTYGALGSEAVARRAESMPDLRVRLSPAALLRRSSAAPLPLLSAEYRF